MANDKCQMAGHVRIGRQMTALPLRREGGKSEHLQATCRVEHAGAMGESPARRKVSQKTNRPRRKSRVRVKRRGKSPPARERSKAHDKPHAVQDITGSAGRLTRSAQAGQLPGISRIRLTADTSRERRERNGHPIRGQPRRDRIRLIVGHP